MPMHRFWLCALFAAALGMTGCGGNGPIGPNPVATLRAILAVPTSTPCPGALRLTLNSSRVSTAEPIGSDTISSVPDRGDKFVIVYVAVATSGKSPVRIEASDFALTDTANRDYSQTDIIDPSQSMSGTVNPGSALAGAIGFEVPSSVSSAVLHYHGCTTKQWTIPTN